MSPIRFRRRRVFLTLLVLVTLLLRGFFCGTTLIIALRDFIYLIRPIWDSEPDLPENLIPHIYAPTLKTEALCVHHGWTPREADSTYPRVIDAFIFSIEIDMLEIRLKELWNVVDIFLIVEADKTFTGKSKPLVFNESVERFLWAKEKIVHRIITDLSEHPKKEFQNEATMRGEMSRFIRNLNPREGDLIIVGDIDELPFSHTIKLLKTCNGIPSELHLEMQNYLYSFEFRLLTTNWKPHVTIYSSGFWYHHGRHGSKYRLADAGWHCSFCFRNIADFIFKMTSYSHHDRVTRTKLLIPSEIQRKICEGADIFDMYPEAFTFKDLIAQLGNVRKTWSTLGIPDHAVENPDRFKFLLPGGCIREDFNETTVTVP